MGEGMMLTNRKPVFLAGLILLMVGLAMPRPALAQAAALLSEMTGRWQGSGEITLEGEAPRRLRCAVAIQPAGQGFSVLSGQCASAQTARRFVYLLRLDGARLEALNRNDPPDDLPARLPGRVVDGGLEIGDESARFTLRVTATGALSFSFAAQGREGRAEAQALLERAPGER